MNDQALQTLKTYFGYGSFRPGQDRMVRAILSGSDALGVMPTGAGKSICYQVPALMMRGLTLVVSPLVSLMGDQVRSLLAAGAHPSYLNSSLTVPQQNTVLRRAEDGWYQIMYVAPERLADPRFVEFAQRLASPGGFGIPLVAVDEAHCVSQWGQDFRPSYLRILEFIEALPQRPVVAAFTATATERVRADIVHMLGLRSPQTVVTGFDRPNLFFGVEELGDKAKAAWILSYVAQHSQESGIIYCSTRKAVDELSANLSLALMPQGILVGRYHAGLSNDERTRNQADFIEDRVPVMVATNAFGMGIDKPNVRYVIHNNVPESIEAYYQEAGRAGRDGDPASCYLLWNGSDFRLRRFLIEKSRDAVELDEDGLPRANLDQEQLDRACQNRYRLLGQMEGYCQTSGCLREYMLRYFGDEGALGAAVVPDGAGDPGVAADDPGVAAGIDGEDPRHLKADGSHGCGACSNCLTTFEVEDVTQIARAIVRFVAPRAGRFGKTLIADALHGANNERVRSCHLDEVAGYGELEDCPLARIKDVIDQLAGRGYLSVSQGQYPVIALGPRAVEVLGERSGGGSVDGSGDGSLAAAPFEFTIKRRAAKRSGSARARRAVDLLREEAALDARPRVGDDVELFESLRELRTDFARERNWAPYMVCNDAALRGMCRRRPHSLEELLDVPGIGEKKAADFGQAFLDRIEEFEDQHLGEV